MQTPRTEWVLQWPGQVVIAGCQTFWTTRVEEAIQEDRLVAFLEVLKQQVSKHENTTRKGRRKSHHGWNVTSRYKSVQKIAQKTQNNSTYLPSFCCTGVSDQQSVDSSSNGRLTIIAIIAS